MPASNTLSVLLPSAIRGFQEVLRETTPFNAVSTGFGEDGVSVGKSIDIPYGAPVVGQDFTPSMTPTQADGGAAGVTSITITKQRTYAVPMTGEDWLKAGALGASFQATQLKQAARALANDIWADIVGLADQASFAVGVAGATPFSSDTNIATAARLSLKNALAPAEDRFLLLDGLAEQNLLNQGQLKNYYQSNSDNAFRLGTVGPLVGFQTLFPNVVGSHTKGTGTAYVTGAAVAKGATQIPLITGSGTVVPGDVVQFAGDSTMYVVQAGIAAPGTITISRTSQDNTGLKVALGSGVAMTIVATHTNNMAFHRSAIGLAIRPIAMPPNGDAAVDYELITDASSGLTIGMALYKGKGMEQVELQAAWGTAVLRRELLGKVLG